MRIRSIALVCLLTVAGSADAQLLKARVEPIVYGHHHLNVTDVSAHTKFFAGTLGGVPVTVAGQPIVKFPNVLVFLRRQPPTGGSEGSSVDHIGFSVPDLRAVLDRVKANGYRVVTSTVAPSSARAFVTGPDGLKVELIEVKTQQAPSVLHHVHFSGPQPAEMRTWYGTVFRAKAVQAGAGTPLTLPGVQLEFSRAAGEVAHTAGRVIDHVGFEIHPLDAFLIRIEDMGLKMTAMQRLEDLGVSTSFITDPWGTSIQLTEGLDRIK
jgi:catechol 2,3-dioxygenase-like lactoylglutathione lyase family enzyme